MKRSELKRERANQKIQSVYEVAQKAHMGAIATYNHLSAADMYEFRVAARKVGVYIKIMRNTLAHRALEGTPFACMQPVLKGPILLAFSMNEPGSVARLLRDFSKDYDKLVIKHLSFEGQLLEAKDLSNMANLPTRDEAITLLVTVLQAPLRQLLGTLTEPTNRLVRTLTSIKDR